MNVVPLRASMSGSGVGSPAGGKGPLKRVKMLLPLWGARYVRQFLRVGLPTWLAPGNIPAVADTLPSEIVFLTNFQGETMMRESATIARLASIIPVRFHNIDHLITGFNHSTTITLAYAEAVRQSGPEAHDTCFFFLVSDFLIADGSLRNALQRVIDGADAVQTGNFQTTAEDASPWLLAQLTRSPHQLSLSPREMLKWAFRFLHPVTVGNMVNFSDLYLWFGNRLFWRVDENTIIGRFFLMHMLCIRPQVIDFEIGSSCDYSFIDEMCPGGRVEIITDSDDYLVIEMQPQLHESGGLRIGRRLLKDLGRALSEWTTALHRRNSRTTLVFHCDDLPPTLEAVKSQADTYLAKLSRYMTSKPKSHRDHPYWRGAIASWREAKGLPLTPFEWRMMMGVTDPLAEPTTFVEKVKEWLVGITGRAPRVRQWHPRRADYDLVLRALEKSRTSAARELLISDTTTPFTATLSPRENVTRIGRSKFLARLSAENQAWVGRFDIILAEMHDWDLRLAMPLIRRALPMLKPSGTLLVSCVDANGKVSTADIASRLALLQSGVMWRTPNAMTLQYVPSARLRTGIIRWFRELGRGVRRHPLVYAPRALIEAPFLLILSYLTNAFVKPITRVKERTPISSLLVTINAAALADQLELIGDRVSASELAEAQELASSESQSDNMQVLS